MGGKRKGEREGRVGREKGGEEDRKEESEAAQTPEQGKPSSLGQALHPRTPPPRLAHVSRLCLPTVLHKCDAPEETWFRSTMSPARYSPSPPPASAHAGWAPAWALGWRPLCSPVVPGGPSGLDSHVPSPIHAQMPLPLGFCAWAHVSLLACNLLSADCFSTGYLFPPPGCALPESRGKSCSACIPRELRPAPPWVLGTC